MSTKQQRRTAARKARQAEALAGILKAHPEAFRTRHGATFRPTVRMLPERAKQAIVEGHARKQW